MTPSRYGVVQFCDDIRQEIGNKFSLMGCYADSLITNSLPIVFPKLCAQVKLFTPAAKPFERLTVRAILENELLGELSVGELRAGPFVSADGLRARYITAMLNFVFATLAVEKPSRLRIEAETEEGVFPVGSLLIIAREQPPAPDEVIPPDPPRTAAT